MRKSKTQVLVIVGPTASGKSTLSIKLAKKFKGEIMSADSRQVYKSLNIGTGKVTRRETLSIPHHLLDVADPRKQFTVSDYKSLAERALKEIEMRSKLPIIVGGTGFYIDALTGATGFPEVPANPEFRKKMMKKSVEELFKLIKRKDPSRARTVDPNNKPRLVRALEIIEALGKVPRLKPKVNPNYDFIFIGLKPDNLEKKIEQRLSKRLKGMIAEAKKLKSKGLSYKRMHELGLEYRFLAQYLQREISREEMAAGLNTAIRQYARRQMTWFKRNKKIKWFKPEEYRGIEKYLSKIF